MNPDVIKRLKSWFYLRLPAEDWTKFGENPQDVFQAMEDDPNQDEMFLHFASIVIGIEAQKDLPRAMKIIEKRVRELTRLGVDRQQLLRFWISHKPDKC
jgi:hypothetical protein